MSAGACTVHCGHLAAVLDLDARRALEGLTFWAGVRSYSLEAGDAAEEARARDALAAAMDDAERLGIPSWIGNAALAFGRDWRETRRNDFLPWLSGRGYQVNF